MSKKVFAVLSLSAFALVACSQNTASVTETDSTSSEVTEATMPTQDDQATSEATVEVTTEAVSSDASSVAAQ